MRLNRLVLDDFLSYEHAEIALDTADIVGVVGANGSGKSSLQDAVLWCLYGGGRGSADEMMREGAPRTAVTVEFTLTGRSFVVHRERDAHTKAGSSSLTMTIDGQASTSHTIPETQARLIRETGVTLQALLAGPVLVQADEDDPHDLMHLRQADRMDLLIELFGLDRFDAYHARAKDWGLAAHAEMDVLEARVTELDALIGQELDARREASAQGDVVEHLTVEVDRMTDEIGGLREEVATLVARAEREADLSRRLELLIEESSRIATRLEALTSEKNRRSDRLAQRPLLPPKNDVASIDALLAPMMGEIVELGALRVRKGELGAMWQAQRKQSSVVATVPCGGEGKFASCRFLVDAVEATNALPALEQEGREVAAKVAALEAKETYANTLARERSEAADQLSAFRADDAERTAAEEAARQADDQIVEAGVRQEAIGAEVTSLNAERMRISQDAHRRDEIAATLARLTAQVLDARKELDGAHGRHVAALAKVRQIDDAKDRRQSVETERRRVHNRAEALRLLTQAFHRDGIPKLILENGIPLIEDRANEVLDRMPGGWRVAVATQRETKSGTLREALDVVISAGGIDRPYRMLSGGERFRVDFALRMALATVLARRGNTQVETLWLDEGWGSQDREGREALLEAIASVSDEFGLIVVVSHVPEVTDAMPQRLEVTKEDGVSTAELVA